MRQHTVLQFNGGQHSLPGLGVGDLPWECTDNPGLADYVYRSTMRGGTPGTTSSHCSARPDAGRLPAAYKGLCIGDICPAQTWLDDRWNFRPARARGSALQRAQLAQMIAWSSNTHTAGIHMAAANYVGPQPVDGRLPDEAWWHARMVVPNLLGNARSFNVCILPAYLKAHC